MDSISEILSEELDLLQQSIIRRHEDAGQVATGRTRAAFEHYLSSQHVGILEGAMYSGTLERGRGPARGSGNGNSDFLENLKLWIVAKGLDYGGSEKGLERLAKFLKWYINKFGTKLFRSGQREDIFTTPIADFSDRLSERVSNFFYSEIENEIFKI